MFDKILIANRGEIACRVAATARRLGIRTVAVYSDADAGAKHVATCDEAYRLGPAPARESYLRADRILEIARHCGAQAIHPGYGFLSENEAFARAVQEAGLVFIGPPADAIAAMGSKSAAKALMEKAGVPLVPGYHGSEQDPAFLAGEAERIGFPVLIKASAGGGGKGMRIVERADQFAAALASCQREARNAFGDEHVLIERYVLRPRHIEIQVFADTHGNCVHLFERDCSVQRRHQKVIEEAPAPGMTAERRAAMGEAAVAAARAVGYVGAGTVEFIADQAGNFWFMEMNTRLQVEHPVTEMITGQDLVEWQLRVAAGEPLPKAQPELSIDGHAIEVRLYAENPDKGFLPSIGTLKRLRLPDGESFAIGSATSAGGASAGVRVDSGVREGDAITPHYDPMIAKLICHGRDRAEARLRMAGALARVQAAGVQTNAAFLSRLMRDQAFAA
ncbi:MAG: acetyl/propionyl/methylcrotonyl-CoA carboxylase subunit alpha, partial [Gammaproteobacteria bacterium]